MTNTIVVVCCAAISRGCPFTILIWALATDCNSPCMLGNCVVLLYISSIPWADTDNKTQPIDSQPHIISKIFKGPIVPCKLSAIPWHFPACYDIILTLILSVQWIRTSGFQNCPLVVDKLKTLGTVNSKHTRLKWKYCSKILCVWAHPLNRYYITFDIMISIGCIWDIRIIS